jgi:hypothetical protein
MQLVLPLESELLDEMPREAATADFTDTCPSLVRCFCGWSFVQLWIPGRPPHPLTQLVVSLPVETSFEMGRYPANRQTRCQDSYPRPCLSQGSSNNLGTQRQDIFRHLLPPVSSLPILPSSNCFANDPVAPRKRPILKPESYSRILLLIRDYLKALLIQAS